MRMKRRITIQKPNATVDALGQPVPSWTDVREMYASIRETLGDERLRGGQVEHGGRVQIEIYHPRGGTLPSVQHRVQWIERDTGTTRTVHIDHIQRMDEDRRKMLLHCTEVQT